MKKLLMIVVLPFVVSLQSSYGYSLATCTVTINNETTVYNYRCCKKTPSSKYKVWVLNKDRCPGDQDSNACTIETKLDRYKGSARTQCSNVISAKNGYSNFQIMR